MIENKETVGVQIGSERSFGIVFGVVFGMISLYPITQQQSVWGWAVLASIVCIALALFFPKSLRTPNLLWFRFGILLGKIISPVVMGAVFYLIITPIGLFIRRKDLLHQRLDPEAKSYWVPRKEPVGSMRQQF